MISRPGYIQSLSHYVLIFHKDCSRVPDITLKNHYLWHIWATQFDKLKIFSQCTENHSSSVCCERVLFSYFIIPLQHITIKYLITWIFHIETLQHSECIKLVSFSFPSPGKCSYSLWAPTTTASHYAAIGQATCLSLIGNQWEPQMPQIQLGWPRD